MTLPISLEASRAGLIGEASVRRISHEVEDALAKTASYGVSVADYGRRDRLWPAHFRVFLTNPLSLAYGACGPALFLHAVASEGLPTEAKAWMLDQPVDAEDYPPGLYVGLAGIALTFEEIGCRERAEELMAIMFTSPLLFAETNMLLGAAGWGLASLHFYRKTGNQLYLDWAARAGDHLLEAAQDDGETCCWRNAQDGRVHYGFGYGASGIALFLMYLHTITGRDDFRTAAIRGLEYDLSNKVENELGWGWKRHEDDTVVVPYWIEGSAGVGATAIRFSHVLGIQRYETLARRIAEDAFVKYTVFPGLFDGLAGIAEFVLDMYRFTNDGEYAEKAFDIAETILWFKIDRPEGVAWPGQWLSRISMDYSTGGSGIGLFFDRLLRPAERLVLDVDLQRARA